MSIVYLLFKTSWYIYIWATAQLINRHLGSRMAPKWFSPQTFCTCSRRQIPNFIIISLISSMCYQNSIVIFIVLGVWGFVHRYYCIVIYQYLILYLSYFHDSNSALFISNLYSLFHKWSLDSNIKKLQIKNPFTFAIWINVFIDYFMDGIFQSIQALMINRKHLKKIQSM